MPLAWIVPSAIWLVLHFPAESCRKGAASPGKGTRGAVEMCNKGSITASSGRAIQRHTSVTLGCHLRSPPAPGWCRTAIFLNNSEQSRGWGGAVTGTVRVSTYGKHTFTCKFLCGNRSSLVCGIDIRCGSKEMIAYRALMGSIVELSSGTLSRLDLGSNYTLVVSASNELGNASSQPLTFTLIDIVKPHPPNFSVEFDDSSATSCTFSWHDEAQEQHCRLRYRPLGRHSWSMVEIPSRERFHLQGLEPDTSYEFQSSCRTRRDRGLWSDLPPPQRVSAVALGNCSILVSWSPPEGPPVPIGGFVVQWDPHPEPQQSWVKLPPSQLSTVITEHIRDNVC
ncbi:interleukin-12 receptor subunit beta-2-like, partial [Malurus melanocephalus]|uniref:interleukin-12 receptor subunit beta-2-like n=1 Tax=Malurus melanocephalus TaxID=175006 RepID=UPI002546F8EE